MREDLPRSFVIVAFSIALIAAGLLGAVIGNSLKPTSSTATTVAPFAFVTLMVEGELTLGPDNKTHDSFVPSNFTVYAGQTVKLTILNYDTMPHSFTSPSLNVNFQIPESQTPGVPSESNFQFSAKEPGVFRWSCVVPCDPETSGWAMETGTDGQQGQIGFMAGFVIILTS